MARTSAGGIQEIEIQNSTHTYAADAGGTDDYAIALTPAVAAYVTGQRFAFKANTANTTGATLNVNGLGAKTIVKHSSAALASNDIKAGSIVEVFYDGTNFQMVSMLSQAPAGGGDVLKVGTPADNQIGVWTGDGTIEGDAGFTFDGGLGVTVADTENKVGLTVTQNDTTNNPTAVLVTNAGSNPGIKVVNSAVLGVSGRGIESRLSAAQNQATSAAGFFAVDNASSTSTPAIYGIQAGTGDGLFMDTNNAARGIFVDKDVTNANAALPAIQIDTTAVVTDAGTYTKTGAALQINSNVTETSGTITDSANVFEVNQTHNQATGNVVRAVTNAPGIGMFLDYNYDSGTAQQALWIDDENSTGGNQTLRVDSRRGPGVEGFLLTQDGLAKGMRIDQNTTGTALDIDHDANSASAITGLWVNTANAGAGAAYAAIFEAGNVGIGTTTPTVPLDVVGAAAVSGGIALPVHQSISFDTAETISSDGSAMRFRANSSLVMRIDSGKVTIGQDTIDATGKLNVFNTTDSASVQTLTLQGDRATPTVGDNVYQSFYLSDSAGNQDEFARITGQALDITSTSEDGELYFGVTVAGTLTNKLKLDGTNLRPNANDGTALGAATNSFSDLFLAEGGVINWDNGDATLTQASNDLTLAGASLTARVKPRTGTTTSSATPTINTDDVDFYSITAQTEAITSFTTNLSGTPTEGQTLWIAITGTAARAITWGASFEASTVALPTTTVTTNRLDVGFIWNTVTSKWRCIASA